MRHPMLLPCLLLLATAQARADPVWTANGPHGSSSIAMLAASPDWLYAATGDGVFLSNDQGTNWQRSGSQIPRGATISTVAVHPLDPAFVLAATGNTVYRSTDAGASWSSVAVGAAPTRFVFSSQVAYPNEVLFVSSSASLAQAGVLHRSSNRGVSWQAVNGPGGGPLLAKGVASDPGRDRYYALDGGQQVLMSVNGGTTWTQAGAVAFPSANGRQPMLVNRANNDFVIFSADNLDATYVQRHRASTGVTAYAMTALRAHELAADPAVAGRLWFSATSEFGPGPRLYESTNHGQNWAEVASDRAVRMLAADPLTAGRLYGDSSAGVEVSDDAGRHWESRSYGIPQAATSAISIDAVDPDNIVATTVGNGVWRSGDAGETWAAVVVTESGRQAGSSVAGEAAIEAQGAPVIDGNTTFAVATHPYNSQRMAALRQGPFGPAAFVSNDGGQSWQIRGLIPLAGVTAFLRFDPCDPAALYAATGDWVYRSADLGLTWQQEPMLLRSRGQSALDVACNAGQLTVAVASLATSVQVRTSTPNDRILRDGFDDGFDTSAAD